MFSEIFTRDVLIIGGIVAVVLVVLLIYALRMRKGRDAVVERASGFGGLEGMKRRGLLTEEEVKTIRQKMARAHLREVQEEQGVKGMDAGTLLAALEANPQLAGELLPPPNPLARQSMKEYYDARKKRLENLGSALQSGTAVEMSAGASGQTAGAGIRRPSPDTPVGSPAATGRAAGPGRAGSAPLRGEPPRVGAPLRGEPPRVGPPVRPGEKPAVPGEAAEAPGAAPEAAAGDPLAGRPGKPAGAGSGLSTEQSRPHSRPPQKGQIDIPHQPRQPAPRRELADEEIQGRLPPELRVTAKPKPDKKQTKGPQMDLDKLLKQGLITPEEYQRLLAKMQQVKD